MKTTANNIDIMTVKNAPRALHKHNTLAMPTPRPTSPKPSSAKPSVKPSTSNPTSRSTTIKPTYIPSTLAPNVSRRPIVTKTPVTPVQRYYKRPSQQPTTVLFPTTSPSKNIYRRPSKGPIGKPTVRPVNTYKKPSVIPTAAPSGPSRSPSKRKPQTSKLIKIEYHLSYTKTLHLLILSSFHYDFLSDCPFPYHQSNNTDQPTEQPTVYTTSVPSRRSRRPTPRPTRQSRRPTVSPTRIQYKRPTARPVTDKPSHR